MGILHKYKTEILILFLIIVTYFILRLPNLTLQPIFADEAIYIRWAQVMRAESTLRFLPQSDGKTPLFMWSLMPVLKLIEDPLFAGRLLSIFNGLVSLVGVFALSWKVFGRRVAFWSAFLYAVVPYTVFFDRMALTDSMLSAFTVWALYFAIWLSQKVRLDLSMILGFILGGAWLTKTPGFINLMLLPVSILAFKKKKEQKYQFLRLLLFWGVAIFIALLMYNILRLGPNFHLLSSRNADYIFSPVELSGRPLDPFIPHFRDISDWFPKLFTWPVIGGLVVGIWRLMKERNKSGWVVLIWAFTPLLLNMAFLKTFTTRYLLPQIPLLLIFAGYGIERISNLKSQMSNIKFSKALLTLIILVILSILPLNFSYQLLTNPPPSALPKESRIGYFEEWTAGYGLAEIAQYLIEQRKEGSVVVGTEGFFGTLPDGLYIYLDQTDIAVIGSPASISAQLRDAARDHQTFFVGNKSRVGGGLDHAILIKEFPKTATNGSKQDAMVLYRLK